MTWFACSVPGSNQQRRLGVAGSLRGSSDLLHHSWHCTRPRLVPDNELNLALHVPALTSPARRYGLCESLFEGQSKNSARAPCTSRKQPGRRSEAALPALLGAPRLSAGISRTEVRSSDLRASPRPDPELQLPAPPSRAAGHVPARPLCFERRWQQPVAAESSAPHGTGPISWTIAPRDTAIPARARLLVAPKPGGSTGYSEVIVVVGGCERVGGFNLPYTECYDPVTGEWKSLAKLPEFTKSEYAVCALRNDILVSGGRINSRDVWIYNSQLNIWIRVASLNKGRWRHKMAVLLGKVYVVGGYDGQNRLSSVECYDSFSNRWTEVAPLKEAVSSPAVTSCVGKLFVIGGGPDDNTCSDKVQSYDPDTNSWLLRATIPIAKRCITAVSLNNLIYVAGGLTKAIYCYDPVEDYWMHVQNTFSRQENCGMSVCNGKIYILGGRRENGEATDTILCYDPATGIITGVAAMPRPVSYHGCVTIHRYNEKGFKL
ncbi:kelch-like protein 24 isoform X2 [Numida meleagris]|uniref:kelch-like protein 24 isoform X2 n=1 Tax=Numida meleagris TaxID=8996 RepID=UPI000B3DF240|nr:kelch-like protein 24 isoform X2 [Numida meleagris]